MASSETIKIEVGYEDDGTILFVGIDKENIPLVRKALAYLYKQEQEEEQKPTEWSEEDEKMRNAILQDLANIKAAYPKINIQDEFDWLKSLRPQQEQLIQVNTLTWKDINDLERIIDNVHYEFRNGIGEKSFGEEVLERFREGRNEQEQPEVGLEKALDEYYKNADFGPSEAIEYETHKDIARHFYELGLNARKK